MNATRYEAVMISTNHTRLVKTFATWEAAITWVMKEGPQCYPEYVARFGAAVYDLELGEQIFGIGTEALSR